MSWLALAAVRRYSPQKAAAKLVLSYIADDVYDQKGGHAIVSHRDLCGETNLTERYLRATIQRLVQAGELVKVTRPGLENAYAIPLYLGEPGYIPPQPCEATDHVCNGNHTPVWDRLVEHRADQDARRQATQKGAKREQQQQKPTADHTEHLERQRGRQRPPSQLPATPPDTLGWPAGSDVTPSTNPAGELGGRDDRRHAEAAANAEALRWSERTRRRFPTPAERRHAYALDQGYPDWPALVADRAERFARLEAHA